MGAAVLVLAAGCWAYYAGLSRFAAILALGGFSPEETVDVLAGYQLSLLLFLAAVGLLLAAALLLVLMADAARRENQERLVHWLKHRGCPVDEPLDLIGPDEGLGRLVELIETAFPRPDDDARSAAEHKDHVEELKARFIEIITHQLQTPLTSIRWNIESLLNEEVGKLNVRQRELLRVTDRGFATLMVMIDDWVQALDVERGFLRMNIEALPLEKYVDLVLSDLAHAAALKRIEIRKRFSRGLPEVRADKGKLVFVLKKLLHNAVTYTPEGGKVAVSARRDGDHVRVEVSDTGVGIPYEEQRDIFKKFFRASNAALIEPNASGVGLFVAKTLIEAFGGSISFRSSPGSAEPGKGTVFIFTLPAAAPPKAKRGGRRGAA